MISVLPFISSVCMVQWTLVHPGNRRELWYSKVLPRHHSRVGAGRYQVCRALNHSRIVATPVIGNYCGLSMFLLLIFHFYWTWTFDHRHSSKNFLFQIWRNQLLISSGGELLSKREQWRQNQIMINTIMQAVSSIRLQLWNKINAENNFPCFRRILLLGWIMISSHDCGERNNHCASS